MDHERFARAVQLKMKGQYEASLSLFVELCEQHPENAEIWHEMGLIYSYQARIDESIGALEIACALNPHSLRYLENLGKTYAMYGDEENAKRILERLLNRSDWP